MAASCNRRWLYRKESSMWRYAIVMLVAFSASLAVTQAAQLDDRPPGRIDHDPPLDAKRLIKHCWAISLELRSSPNTNAQRAGGFDTAWCLEKEIIHHASHLMDDTAFAAPLADTMEQLRKAYGKLYWSIYNGVEACELSCGTMNYVIPNLSLAELYVKILTDIIDQRIRYGAPPN